MVEEDGMMMVFLGNGAPLKKKSTLGKRLTFFLLSGAACGDLMAEEQCMAALCPPPGRLGCLFLNGAISRT